MTAYYNENDTFAAAWLLELIKENLIAPGEVDTRSISDVTAGDLKGFTQHHFFAGVGGWSYALRLAGWPDDRPVWTGSCPCQPFSVAGKRKGKDDKRHLWPELRRLVAECSPPTVFGEQVASKDGRVWLAGVRTDLEALGYAVGGADLCAASVGAPHIRQRLYWMADARHAERRAINVNGQDGCDGAHHGRQEAHSQPGTCSEVRGLAHSNGGIPRDGGLQPGREYGQQPQDGCVIERVDHPNGTRRNAAWSGPEGEARDEARLRGLERGCTDIGGLGDTDDARSQGRREHVGEHPNQFTAWAASVFILCLDGKHRRVPANAQGEPEPALFPLAHGVSSRVGKLRGSGNAIVPQVAAEFIKASMNT